MNRTIIQEGSFKASEYGEVVIVGQPMITEVFFDFYPNGVYGEPREAEHKEKGPPFEPPVMTHIPVVETPSPNGGGWAPPTSATVPSPAVEPTPEGLEESFAEPRMALYASSCPRDGWKKIGDFKSHIYQNTTRSHRFYRIIHPVGCPFEGKVIVTAKNE